MLNLSTLMLVGFPENFLFCQPLGIIKNKRIFFYSHLWHLLEVFERIKPAMSV